MMRLVVPSILMLLSALGLVGFDQLDSRLADYDRLAVHPAAVAELEDELAGLQAEIALLSEQLAASRERELTEAVLRLEQDFGHARAQLAEAGGRIETLEAVGSRIDPVAVEQRIEQLTTTLEHSQRELEHLRELEGRLEGESEERLAALRTTFEERLSSLVAERNTERMWSELLAPSVQILGDSTVGSGVLLRSRPLDGTGGTGQIGAIGGEAGGARWRTYVLTAWHVVRDVYGEESDDPHPVPVKVYQPSGDFESFQADLVISNVELDVALLELRSRKFHSDGVALGARSSLAAISVFDPIYAVGCPLGNDPIPTRGEIVSKSHEIDGVEYWMVSAPTYIGNSGGGIFDARTHELLGIFSKIYTHGSMRSTIVPHMGLATPMERIYDWLDERGFGALVDLDATLVVESASGVPVQDAR